MNALLQAQPGAHREQNSDGCDRPVNLYGHFRPQIKINENRGRQAGPEGSQDAVVTASL